MTDVKPITKEEREAFRLGQIPAGYSIQHTASIFEAALAAAEAEIERLAEALRQIAEAHHLMIEPDFRIIARAALKAREAQQ